MNLETKAALNVLLHESTVEGIEVDTDALDVACTLALAAEPSFGLAPSSPCTLVLRGVGRVRVALVNPDGTTPTRGMNPISLADLNGLVRHFQHRQQGFDFIDSSRDDITHGRPMVDWVGNESVSSHTLTFFYGLQSPDGHPAILLVRIWFDQFDLWASDGSSVDLAAYADAEQIARTGAAVIVVPGPATGMVTLPDPIPAQLANGALVALLFVDSETRKTRCRAVGKGIWTGKELRWLSPGRTMYGLPAEKQLDIRPALEQWSLPGDPMGGFAFWITIDVATDDPFDPRELVDKYLRVSPAMPRADA